MTNRNYRYYDFIVAAFVTVLLCGRFEFVLCDCFLWDLANSASDIGSHCSIHSQNILGNISYAAHLRSGELPKAQRKRRLL